MIPPSVATFKLPGITGKSHPSDSIKVLISFIVFPADAEKTPSRLSIHSSDLYCDKSIKTSLCFGIAAPLTPLNPAPIRNFDDPLRERNEINSSGLFGVKTSIG